MQRYPEASMKKVKYRLQCSVFAHHAIVDEQKNRIRRALLSRSADLPTSIIAGGRSCDDGDAGTAAALPPSETYSRGGDDGGGEIGPVAPLHLLTAWTSSTACSSKLAFGIGSSNSAKELALEVSVGFGAGAAWADPNY
jgi:hypothetical protein